MQAGQVTLQYHGGGGALAGELGVLFGRRKRYPRPLRVQMAVQKPLYHLARARSIEELRLRRALYFSGGCPPVERGGPEGERLMLANVMAMNYGFAFRLSIYAILTELLNESFGRDRQPADRRLAAQLDLRGGRRRRDRGRPSAQLRSRLPGVADGAPPALRQDRPARSCCRARTGPRPTSAWRARALDSSLHSASHGAGSTIKRFAKRGAFGTGPTSESRRCGSTTARGGPVEVEQLDDRGVDDALSILVSHDIVRPVARLRPFAVLN